MRNTGTEVAAMPEPVQNAVRTTLTAIVILLALCLIYIQLVLIPRLKEAYRDWRYC